MRKILTESGRAYCYDRHTNRIGLWAEQSAYQLDSRVEYAFPSDFSTSDITMFTVELTQQCNLRCDYCCYSGAYRDRRAHNPQRMSWTTLQMVVDFIVKQSKENQETITVCFYGGEALLAQEQIDWTVKALRKHLGERVHFALSTNGVLLTRRIIEWICGIPNFDVNVSLDGDRLQHDNHRKKIDGKGSFDVIYNNLRSFKSIFPEEYERRVRFLTTVRSCDEIRKQSLFWEQDCTIDHKRPVHISYVIPNFDNANRVYDSKERKTVFYEEALCHLMEGKTDVMTDTLHKLTRIVEERKFYPLPDQLTINTCLQEMYSCYINVYGQLYACEKFCDSLWIGSLEKGFDTDRMKDLLNAFVNRKNRLCTSCWASRLCRICLSCLNYDEGEMPYLCNMERDSIELALRFYCEMKELKIL